MNTTLSQTQLRNIAREKALLYVYEQAYRHKARYQYMDKNIQDELGLDPIGAELIASLDDNIHKSEAQWKYIVVNLPPDAMFDDTLAITQKYVNKTVYVGQWYISYETGSKDTHPHWNILFKQTNKQLDHSRIRSDIKRIYKVKENFINIQSLAKQQVGKTLEYIKKEKKYYEDSH